MTESRTAFARYAANKDSAPGQKHLVDLSRMTDMSKNYAKIMAMQARFAGVLGQSAMPAILVYYAPTPLGQHLASVVLRSWEGLDGPPIRILEDETEALKLLGCEATRIADLKRRVSEE